MSGLPARLRQAVLVVSALEEHVTPGPWWMDENDNVWRLHGTHARLPAIGTAPASTVDHQILKAPKHSTPYAERWPSAADGAHIAMWHPGATRHAVRLLAGMATWLDNDPAAQVPMFLLDPCDQLAGELLRETRR